MGFTRFCHGSRIVAYEPGFFYASPTNEAIALSGRMAAQLLGADSTGGQRREPLTATSTPQQVSEAERDAFVHELWLPSHHEYASVGAILRVMNYLCYVNSKVLFRQLRMMPAAHAPIAVQINYHSDAVPRMRAVVAKYLDGDASPLKQLPLADASNADDGGGAAFGCERGSNLGGSGPLAAQLIAASPYAWGGVGDMSFKDGGVLETPWGQGKWGMLSEAAFYADFVGAKHNVRVLESGMGISTRCSDSNVVLVRSIKAAKAKA